MAAIAAGVSTRRYAGTLDELPPPEEPLSVSKSAVSRRFVALSQEQLDEWLSRSMKELDLPVVMIDGIHFRDRVILVALGIDAQGNKHVLGLREGSTEARRVVRSLLSDLVERGLDADRTRLWVIDGGKALRKAIVECFGDAALIQRCQEHKRRNVIEHLPEATARQRRPRAARCLGRRQRRAGEEAVAAPGGLARTPSIPAPRPACARVWRRR